VSIRLVIRLYWLFRDIMLRAPRSGGVGRRSLDTAGCKEKQREKGTNQN